MSKIIAKEIVRVVEEGSRKFMTRSKRRMEYNIKRGKAPNVDFIEERKKLVRTSI